MSDQLSVRIARCRICESRNIEMVLDLGRQPLANSLRSSLDEDLPVFPLELCRCADCGTIQLTETVDPGVLFSHYVWVTGTSEGARRYSHTFYDRLIERTGKDRVFAVEVASNDGTFLKRFVEGGHRAVGVDPAKNIAELARQDGVPTLAEFFGLDVARRIVDEHGHADVVFARNVIPHVADANDVVAGMAHCLSEEGVGAIEFHRADIILEELHYDSIYHEHLFYHSIDSMGRLLNQFGLHPFDVAPSPISGGSLVVYFSKTPRPATAALDEIVAREEALGVADARPWAEFAEKSRRHRDELREMVRREKDLGRRLIGYGASARSSTLLNFAGIGRDELESIADRAPLKHGRYTPGTDIPIIAPEDAIEGNPDVILLLGWNFRDEIIDQIRNEYGWSGEVILPLPGDPEKITI